MSARSPPLLPGDPKECRQHALKCAELAEKADSPERAHVFQAMAEISNRLGTAPKRWSMNGSRFQRSGSAAVSSRGRGCERASSVSQMRAILCPSSAAHCFGL
jgi:hypothetical protein